MKEYDKKMIKAVMLGHAVADALGVPVEFMSRESLKAHPVTDMTGYGSYDVPAGTWSDDTSMSLCALDVLADGVCDFDRIMLNFVNWYTKEEFTATDTLFDIGVTCTVAIENYYEDKLPWNECGLTSGDSNGNGSLMRIHPFTLYLKYCECGKTLSEKLDIIYDASALTHAHARSKVGCGIYSFVLWKLLDGCDKNGVRDALAEAGEYYNDDPEYYTYERLFLPDFDKLPESEIKSSGYVLDTLEAALWCLLTTNSFEECVLKAVNLGRDTDTVGAVAGGLAGALYGLDAIPEKWLDTLKKREYIEEMCERASKNFM